MTKYLKTAEHIEDLFAISSTVDGVIKNHISPPLVRGDKGEEEDNWLKHQSYSPSPRPSPVKGEGAFSTFYETANC
ncbi:MAG: hypothetical protein JRE23_18070 [Deltaproteobacteria bacterium]|nr:hypothetical protein [Deltaproteobacteria bacterium]